MRMRMRSSDTPLEIIYLFRKLESKKKQFSKCLNLLYILPVCSPIFFVSQQCFDSWHRHTRLHVCLSVPLSPTIIDTRDRY